MKLVRESRYGKSEVECLLMKKMLIITLLVALLLALFIVLLIDLGLVITGVVVVVTAVLIIVPRYFRTRCPKCGKKWALRGTGFSRPREEPSLSGPRQDGQDDEWECKFCGHKLWKKKPVNCPIFISGG